MLHEALEECQQVINNKKKFIVIDMLFYYGSFSWDLVEEQYDKYVRVLFD